MRWIGSLVVGTGVSGCLGAGITLEIIDTEGTGSGTDTDGSPTSLTLTGNDTTGDTPIVDDLPAPTGDPPPPSNYCPMASTVITGVAPTMRAMVSNLDGDGVDELYLVEVIDGPDGIERTTVLRLNVPFEGDWFPTPLAESYSGGFAGMYDVDGDGLRDLIVSQPNGPMGYPFLYHPAESLDSFSPLPQPVFNPPNRRIEFHELNDDGIADILARPDGTSVLELWLGTGAGDFVPGLAQDFPGSIATQGLGGRTPGWFATLSRTFSDFGCTDAWPSTIQIDVTGQLLDLRTGPVAKYDRLLDVVDVDGNGLPDLFLRACEDPPGTSYGAALLMSYPEGLTTVASATNAGVVGAADLDGNLEVDLVWSDATDGTLVTQFTVGGVPGTITYGAAIPAGARGAGHGRLFGGGFEQVVATVADDTGGLTVMLVSGTPC